jgi:enoyl-CoA hydratase/carnithine racemase
VELRRSDRDDRVLELVLRNERSRNSLTGPMMCQLHDIVLELTCPSFKQYQGCCALILRGEGSTFCSGADFHLAAKIASPAQGLLMADLMTTTLTRLRCVLWVLGFACV